MVLFTCPACLEFGYDDESNCRWCDSDGLCSVEEYKAWRDEALECGLASFTRGCNGEAAWAIRRDREPGKPWLVRLRTYAANEEKSLVVATLEDAVEAVRKAFKVPAERRVA